jgi:hypothetical protein
VGSPLFCNVGAWTGIGPISFTWQWELAGGAAIEGATTSSFVAPTELAGASVRCAVTAADSVETTSASSPAVTIGAYPTAPARQPLIAAIALAHLTARGSRASVPVFTSAAGIATLEATPAPAAPRTRARRHAPVRRPARHPAHASAPRRASGKIIVQRAVNPGRNAIVLTRLRPGFVYLLRLTVESANGQTADSSATLRVTRR